MTEGAVVAISATLAALLGPAIMLWLTQRNASQAKQEDWNRQDEIASRIIGSNEEIAKRVGEVAQRHEERIEQVHVLVNSDMTRSLRSELVALKALHILQIARPKPSKPESEEVAATAARIVELEAQVKERIEAEARASVPAQRKEEG